MLYDKSWISDWLLTVLEQRPMVIAVKRKEIIAWPFLDFRYTVLLVKSVDYVVSIRYFTLEHLLVTPVLMIRRVIVRVWAFPPKKYTYYRIKEA